MDTDIILGLCTITTVIVCGIVNLTYTCCKTYNHMDEDFIALQDVV